MPPRLGSHKERLRDLALPDGGAPGPPGEVPQWMPDTCLRLPPGLRAGLGWRGRGDTGRRTPRTVGFQVSAPSTQLDGDARPADLGGHGLGRVATQNIPQMLLEEASVVPAPTTLRRSVLQGLRVRG